MKRENIRKKRKPKTPFDKHHIFYIRKEWNKGVLNRLRLHPYCIVKVYRNTLHRHIHTHLACIPAPQESSVQKIIDALAFLEKNKITTPKDTLVKRLAILIVLFDLIEQPVADALREQLKLVYEFKNPL